MIGVVVPANDEEALIGRCLEALAVAANHPDLGGEPVHILVVLDSCRDRTAQIVRAHGVASLEVEVRNVGAARAAGATAAIESGARWLAFSDADSAVEPDWLARQLAPQADAVCGVVTVDDWSGCSMQARIAYEAAYVDADHHRHIHGASLGVSTDAYLRVGGFPPLRCSEDVALVHRLGESGARIHWTNKVRARTSARRVARAPEGFAKYVDDLHRAAASRAEPA